jgi:DNA polymerase-3 subunit gamma/tau
MVQGLLGVTAAQEVITLTEALLQRDVAQALQVVARVASQGADVRQFSRDIVQHIRLVMLVKADPNGTAIEAAESEADAIRSQAERAAMGALVFWLRRLSELDYELRTSPYGQLPLELAVVEAIAGPATPPPSNEHAPRSAVAVPPQHASSGTPARASAPPVTANNRPVAPPVAPPVTSAMADSAPTAAAPLGERRPFSDLEDLHARWPAIVRDLRSRNRNLEAMLKSGIELVDLQGEVIIIKADNDWLLSKIKEASNITLLEQMIERHTGVVYRVRSANDAPKVKQVQNMRNQIRDTTTNPLVRAAMNVFDADVVSIETPDQGAES